MRRLIRKTLVGVAAVVITYAAICYPLYFAGYRLYRVPTEGMQPTIRKNEKVFGRLVNGYGRHVHRFEIVVIVQPNAPQSVLAKRVIGLPGEHVTVDWQGVRIDGRQLNLPSSMDLSGLILRPCDVQIGSDAIFVLGDNLRNSLDSRYFGSIPISSVLGYIVFKK